MQLDDSVRDEIDSLVGAAAMACGAPDVVTAVSHDGRIEHLATGTGADGDRQPPDEHTVFRIASMTKSFTAATVLRLRDEGALRLDDPVAMYVPAAAALRDGDDSDAPPLTLRDLLTMSSGLATDDAWADRHLAMTDGELDALVAAGATFAHPPRTAMQYSNLSYALLGRVVAAVTGTSCQRAVRELVLGPLRLDSTVWSLDELAERHPGRRSVAAPHRRDEGMTLPDAPPQGDGAFAPMGGLWSDIADLVRWADFLADAFPARPGPDPGPVRRSSRREMQQVHRAYVPPTPRTGLDGTVVGHALGYGMGLQVLHHTSLGAVTAHSGGLPGYGSNMRWVPDLRVSVIALANVTYAPMADLTASVLHALATSGSLVASARAVAPGLRAAVERVVALLGRWDDATASSVFAGNVALDESFVRRRSRAGEVIERCGGLAVRSVSALSATEADVDLVGERGEAVLRLQLSPHATPLVQWYELEVVEPAIG